MVWRFIGKSLQAEDAIHAQYQYCLPSADKGQAVIITRSGHTVSAKVRILHNFFLYNFPS